MASFGKEPQLSSLLRCCAARKAGMIVYETEKEENPACLSYGELYDSATQQASFLRQRLNCGPEKIILIHMKSHLDNIVWFWTVVLAGCVPVLSTPLVNNSNGRKSHFQHLYQLLLDPLVLTKQELISTDFAENNILRVLPVEIVVGPRNIEKEQILPGDRKEADLTTGYHDGLTNGRKKRRISSSSNEATSVKKRRLWKAEHGKENDNGMTPEARSLKDVAVLMLTSGSTGNAKAVCLSPKQIFSAIEGKLFAMPLPAKSSLLNWIGLDHVASLIEIHLSALAAGLDQIHVPAANVIANPLQLLRLSSKHSVSRTFAPNFFLQRLLHALRAASDHDLEDINLERLLYVASGGEPNNTELCAQVAEHLVKLGGTNMNIIKPGFGMTETCAGAIFNRSCPETDLRAGREFASVGRCVRGIEMRIQPIDHLDSRNDETSSAYLEGALELKGPIVSERYFNDDEATRESFTADGWFKTGDLATIDADNNLSLVGRSKELININGVKHLPHELEGAIEDAQIPGISRSFVVCFSHYPPSNPSNEEIHVIYQHEYDPVNIKARTETLKSISRTVSLFAGTKPHVLPLPPGWLQKTTLGKLSRSKVRQSLVQGVYRTQEEINTTILQSYMKERVVKPQGRTEGQLLDIFKDTLRLDNFDISVETPMLDVGVSSVDVIQLKSRSEKALNVSDIPLIIFFENTTIRSLALAIDRMQIQEHKRHYNPIVTLQRNGSKTPLWLIHPGIGEVLVFLGLVKYFQDRPVYALRSRGFNPGEAPFKSLTEVVATYYHAIREQQPHGPYAIAGYSYGSMLAFEIAKILEANNHQVQFLASFNLPPHIKDRMRTLDWTAGLLHISHFCAIITEQRSQELVNVLKDLSKADQVSTLLREGDRKRCAELALTHESLLNWVNVAFALQKIGWNYEPTGFVSCLDVFYCQPLKAVASTRQEYRETKLDKWADFVRSDVRFHEVDGEHYTMIGPSHVYRFQQVLKRALVDRGL